MNDITHHVAKAAVDYCEIKGLQTIQVRQIFEDTCVFIIYLTLIVDDDVLPRKTLSLEFFKNYFFLVNH